MNANEINTQIFNEMFKKPSIYNLAKIWFSDSFDLFNCNKNITARYTKLYLEDF